MYRISQGYKPVELFPEKTLPEYSRASGGWSLVFAYVFVFPFVFGPLLVRLLDIGGLDDLKARLELSLLCHLIDRLRFIHQIYGNQLLNSH